jgi:hypothetical protein
MMNWEIGTMDFDFKTVDVKEELVQALKSTLPKFNFGAVKVIKSDPQTHTEMPCIGINRISDDESNQSIGDHHGQDYNSTTKVYVTEQGTFFSEAVEVRVWHTNADKRDELYNVVKAVLFAIRLPLVQKGLINVTLGGGRDEQDSSMQNAPLVIYWSAITMRYLNPMNVEVYENVEAISDITVDTVLSTTINIGGQTP